MARKSPELPAFRSEAEEAAWYATPEGRRSTQRAFERALRKGTLRRSSGARVRRTDAKLLAQLMEQAKSRATRAVSIRIPVADLERAREIARKKGVGYQSVVKEAIRKGLKKVG
jgi:cytosine/adenosine deaminase-related metal-dependent hydrolase